jgi:threonine dehydrogenase-like Zn-dependent dehydrogenase
MKALCWVGVDEVSVETVPDPRIENSRDAIVKVTASSMSGTDLHLIDGYVPGMREGDVLGHEFVGEVVETGPGVNTLEVGEKVVVGPVIGCGGCWFCRTGQWSLCDNSNPNPVGPERLWGHAPAGFLGSSHLTGGFAGSHAEYVRVPFADYGAYRVPSELTDDDAVYASDSAPTGWMAAELCAIHDGPIVAVWGAGAVGQLAARSALALGAEQVIVIDRYPERLAAARDNVGAHTLDYEMTDVPEALRDLTAGRGPDCCIEAVGMEAHEPAAGTYQRTRDRARDRAREVVRPRVPGKTVPGRTRERPSAVREAILACRKGGTVVLAGEFTGRVDGFPLGALMNKALALRSGQQHAQRYIPVVLDRMVRGDLWTGYLTTHPMSLDEGPRGYALFKHRADGCLRAVFHPQASPDGAG